MTFDLKLLSSILLTLSLLAGRVVDTSNQGIGYATVYLQSNPIVGTATGNDGSFSLEADISPRDSIVISFIGYEKKVVVATSLLAENQPNTEMELVHHKESNGSATGESLNFNGLVVLREQPIALNEMVVSAKASKQKNKRKEMAQLLYRAYNRMLYDLPSDPVSYHVVSDVKMDAQDTPWAMEQMIATIVELPDSKVDGHDSIQFAGEYCKRFLQQTIRNRADTILAGSKLDPRLRKPAVEMDSGVVVHRSLWAFANPKYMMRETMEKVRNWSVSRENERFTVLTYTDSHNYLGIFKYQIQQHYILDSETLRLCRFVQEAGGTINIPFGYKLSSADLEIFNLINMNQQEIDKFRVRSATMHIEMNTIYQNVNGLVVKKENNLHTTALIQGTRRSVINGEKAGSIPIDVKATQLATSVTTKGVSPLTKSQMPKRVPRTLVPIY